MNPETEQRWNDCLRYIRSNLPEQTFKTWFEPLHFVGFSENKLTINAPNKFVCEFIDEHFSELIRTAIVNFFGHHVVLLYNLAQAAAPAAPAAPAAAAQPASPPASGAATPFAQSKLPPLDARLNDSYTFDNYVEGASNKLARAVGLSIAEKPGQATFNPFFLYGPSGVGKTHLVNAIGLRICRLFPEKRVLFVSAHVFKTQYTESVIRNTFNDFINFYQTIDVLIIDDIQELTTAKTQQAFFHIFNHLQQNRRQLVITCDRPPVLFEGIEERMLTRFKWGIVAEIERPDIELRRNILLSKIKRDGLSFPAEVVQYIAQNVSDSVRDLEGTVNAIMANSVVYNCDIDLPLTARVMARIVNLEKKELTPDDITQKMAAHYGVKAKDLSSKSRKQNFVLARQLAMYLCHKYTGLPYSQIGRRFGGRDHSTVLHACRQVEHRLSTDKAFRREVEELESQLKK